MAANDTSSSVNEELFETSLREVEVLSDEELFDRLKQTGKDIGPIVGTTRRLYQKQLAIILSSPNANGNRTTNGNADEQNGDISDSDGYETSSRASRSSRGSSLPKKTRSSVAPTPTKVVQEDRAPVKNKDEDENSVKRESATSFATPSRPARSFEDFVAESEARKARSGDSYLRREGSRARSVEPAEGRGMLGIVPILLALALLAGALAYVYMNYGQALFGGVKTRDSIIDEEIDKITQSHD